MKARHKATGQLVAIKKFKESDSDEQVKKTAIREISILRVRQSCLCECVREREHVREIESARGKE